MVKRIAFVLERLGNGGAERVTAALAKEFVYKYKYEVHIFTFVKEENEYEIPKEVVRHVMPNIGRSRLDTIRKKCFYLDKEVKRINPDVVFSLATPKTTIMLSFLSINRRFKFIVSERNDPNSYPKGVLLKKLRDLAYSISDGIVFQTEDARDCFCNLIRKKSIVIPNPISASLPDTYCGIRDKRIVNFCRLEPQKNLMLLIESMVKIHIDYPGYVLEIYGDGSQRIELQNYCIANGIDKYIHFMGFENEIYKKIVNAALFVSSSNYEGISNSMLEAVAIGVPTISTDCPIGGARMVIEDHKNGILVPVNGKTEMVAAIKEILSNENFANQLSANGVKIRDKFSVGNIAEQWDGFAKGVIKK